MYIRYNNNLYELIKYREQKKITTYFNDKCDDTFEKTWDYYAKDYLDEDINIQDIFDVQFYLDWDSHLEKVETTWEILTQKNYLVDEQALLVFAKGRLPGGK